MYDCICLIQWSLSKVDERNVDWGEKARGICGVLLNLTCISPLLAVQKAVWWLGRRNKQANCSSDWLSGLAGLCASTRSMLCILSRPRYSVIH